MRVVTASGESVELGITETTPTIGITDYSRRVTDDFGVTRVVPRSFSRRLSVKLALPFGNVDGLQQRLAALRATSALWIADERFSWLRVQGYYKDFSLDLAVAPVSLCTLTVEGLAEGDDFSDPGGDPAPDKRASSLRLLQPVAVSDTVLANSTVAENDHPAWSASQTYAAGARAPVSLVATPNSASLASDAADGSFISAITNVPSGVRPAVSPNDGRFVIAGDATNGWKVVKGMSALSDGPVSLTVTATGANSATIAVTITAAVAPTLTAYSISSETQSFSSAATARGETVSSGRQNRHDRMVRRLKAATKMVNGVSTSLTNAQGQTIWQTLMGLYVVGDTEAQWMTNLKSPGTNDLTKVGTPTYSMATGAGGFSTTNYYHTGITLAQFSNAGGNSLGFLSSTSAASANADMGATDGTAGGLLLYGSQTSTSKMGARVFGISVVPTEATDFFIGSGWNAATRTDANTVHVTRAGTPFSDIANPYSASTGTNPIGIGYAVGGGAASSRTIIASYVAKGALTPAMEMELYAAVQDYVICVQNGDPFIYEVGVGPQTINADVLFYGLSSASLCGAYAAKRAGLSVALVGDWYDTQLWDVGGMIHNGLNWIDLKDASKTGGVFRDVLSYANQVGGTTNANTQAALSPEPRQLTKAIRRMLDPARTGALLPGMDVPIYMTGGITGATGNGISGSITTRDGRTFNFSKGAVEGSYDGDLLYYSNAPTITGREPAGTGQEAGNGYYTAELTKPTDGAVEYNISPYLVDGDANSGLLPDTIAEPTITPGAADPFGGQSMNYRLTLSKLRNRYLPFDRTPPKNYNPLRYEGLGRLFAAATANGRTVSSAAIIVVQALGSGTIGYDANNADVFSTDVANSGVRQIVAGRDIAERLANFRDINDYMRGYFYWLLYSGDSRIQSATRNAIAAYTLDPSAHLDPGPNGQVGWPDRAYTREPHVRLKNTGAMGSGVAVLDNNDLARSDGTTPRSTKTLTIFNYRSDVHYLRRIAKGGATYTQGGYHDTAAGGADQIAPIPLEVLVPDKGAAKFNLVSITAPSVTALAYAGYRMEPNMGQGGESAAILYSVLPANTAVNDVDYPTLRDALLATSPDVTKMYLPQVN